MSQFFPKLLAPLIAATYFVTMSTERYSMHRGGRSYIFVGSDEPLIGETIGVMFERIARTYPDNEALVFVPRDERYSYAQLYKVSKKAAKSLMALGVKSGDRVAIWATNHPEWVIAQFATALIGAVLVTVNPTYRTHELEYGLKDAEVQSLILIPTFKSSNYV